jgi:hypothetical protein
MIGSLVVGAAALATNALPRWGPIALLVGSVVFFLFNTETAAAWFALPYGVAWAAMGYLLWSGGAAVAEQPSRTRVNRARSRAGAALGLGPSSLVLIHRSA